VRSQADGEEYGILAINRKEGVLILLRNKGGGRLGAGHGVGVGGA
jgi:hypothetical protein